MAEIGQSDFEIADIASAATTDIGATDEWKLRITGTTTITGFGSGANRIRFLVFAGILTLTHNGISLILPGGINITTAANDTCIAQSDGSGNWRILNYTKATGLPLRGSLFDSYVAACYSHPGLVSGAAITVVANTLYAHRVMLSRPMTITKLGLQVTTFAAGNALVALHADAGGRPGVQLVSSAAINTGGSNGIRTDVVSQAVAAGAHWLLAVFDATPGIQGIATLALMHGVTTSLGRIYGLSRAFTYGAIPADESAQAYSLASTHMPQLFCGE